MLSTARDIFSIVRVFIQDDDVSFEGRSTRDGTFRKMSFSDVLRIDGMEPERLAFVYNVDDEGEPLKAGQRRRGRKPKRKEWEDVDF